MTLNFTFIFYVYTKTTGNNIDKLDFIKKELKFLYMKRYVEDSANPRRNQKPTELEEIFASNISHNASMLRGYKKFLTSQQLQQKNQTTKSQMIRGLE